MMVIIDNEQRLRRLNRSVTPNRTVRATRWTSGIVLTIIGLVGVLRTFDAIRPAPAQFAFFALAAIGTAVASLQPRHLPNTD